jgi:hypothetical protein
MMRLGNRRLSEALSAHDFQGWGDCPVLLPLHSHMLRHSCGYETGQ